MAPARRPCYKISMSIRHLSVFIASFISIRALSAHPEIAQAPPGPFEVRVEDLLSKLTAAEKIDMISGVNGFDVRPVERLNIPKLHMRDGPCGTRNDGPTTAYPSPVGLAASWDPDLAKRFGESIGRDARARGVNFWLAPAVNIYRVPQNGRNFEYLGEDP